VTRCPPNRSFEVLRLEHKGAMQSGQVSNNTSSRSKTPFPIRQSARQVMGGLADLLADDK
jgi:hypothetical protein